VRNLVQTGFFGDPGLRHGAGDGAIARINLSRRQISTGGAGAPMRNQKATKTSRRELLPSSMGALLSGMLYLEMPNHWKGDRDSGKNNQRCRAAGERRSLGAEPGGDQAGFELAELRTIAGEDAVDR
jgi:hypothetical protein